MSLALVTGASSGIGLAFAEALAARGDDLVVVARSGDRLHELAERLPTRAEVLVADLSSDDGVAAVEQRLAAGDVDLLVNNAGFGTTGTFTSLPVEREEEEIRLNVLALTRLTHAALPSMLERRRGGVINIASIAGFQPAPGNATYSGTKSYVLTFTLSLREELRGTGVTALVVAPGFTKTSFQEVANYEVKGLAASMWQRPDEVVTAALKSFAKDRGLCVPGTPNKVAAAGTHLVPRRFLGRVAGLVSRQV